MKDYSPVRDRFVGNLSILQAGLDGGFLFDGVISPVVVILFVLDAIAANPELISVLHPSF